MAAIDWVKSKGQEQEVNSCQLFFSKYERWRREYRHGSPFPVALTKYLTVDAFVEKIDLLSFQIWKVQRSHCSIHMIYWHLTSQQ